jgi:hypothetical protein
MTYSEEDNQRPVSGGFTRAELAELDNADFEAATTGRLTKEAYLTRQAEAARSTGQYVPEAHEQRMGQAIFGPDYTAPPSPSQNPYAVTAWGQDEEDFVVPSGQRCRLRKVNEEMLLEAGILEKVARLPGLVMQGPIRSGQGKPPVNEEKQLQSMLENPEQLRDLMATMNTLVGLVVVAPRIVVTPPGEERKPLEPGQVYVESVGLGDRVAIMEQAMGGVKKLDSFRE